MIFFRNHFLNILGSIFLPCGFHFHFFLVSELLDHCFKIGHRGISTSHGQVVPATSLAWK